MRITQQQVLTVIGGAFGAGIVFVALKAALVGSGAVLAPIAGSAAMVVLTDRWHKWRQGDRIGIAAFIGGFGAGLLWCTTPWFQYGEGQLVTFAAIVLAVASQVLWWTLHGYRYDKPRSPANQRTNRLALVALLIVIAVIVGFIVIQVRRNGFVF
jgi:hypothetical protein